MTGLQRFRGRPAAFPQQALPRDYRGIEVRFAAKNSAVSEADLLVIGSACASLVFSARWASLMHPSLMLQLYATYASLRLRFGVAL